MGKKHKPWNDALRSREKAEKEEGERFHTPGGDCHVITLAAVWGIPYAEAHSLVGHIRTKRGFISFLTKMGSQPISVEHFDEPLPHYDPSNKRPLAALVDGVVSIIRSPEKVRNPNAICFHTRGEHAYDWHVWPIINNKAFASAYKTDFALSVPPASRLPVPVGAHS